MIHQTVAKIVPFLRWYQLPQRHLDLLWFFYIHESHAVCQTNAVSVCHDRRLPKNILALPRTKDQRELAQWYTACDVYVSPSVEETFGMTVLEAACCGTTPIVYRGTACQEVAQEHGGICVDRGPAHLAEAILSVQKEARP